MERKESVTILWLDNARSEQLDNVSCFLKQTKSYIRLECGGITACIRIKVVDGSQNDISILLGSTGIVIDVCVRIALRWTPKSLLEA